MSCYAVFLKSTNKQIRVFNYDPLIPNDYIRALEKAIGVAVHNHSNGEPCTVELFHMGTIAGRQVFDSENVQRN